MRPSNSFIPGSSLSGYMCSDTPSGRPSLSKLMSSRVSDVAEGMATALCPADSIAQQSDGPSVIVTVERAERHVAHYRNPQLLCHPPQ
ncbi:MAG: hypothetical protein ACI3YT_10300 [Prevotella sp.]